MIGSGRAAATGLGAVIGNNIQERNTNDVYLVSLRMDHGSLGQFDCSSIRRPASRRSRANRGRATASRLSSSHGPAQRGQRAGGRCGHGRCAALKCGSAQTAVNRDVTIPRIAENGGGG
jgi:hypothetical protein